MFVYPICLQREKSAHDSRERCISNPGTDIFCTSNSEIYQERATNKHRDPKCSNGHKQMLITSLFNAYVYQLLDCSQLTYLPTKIRFTVTCFHGMYRIPHDQTLNRESESDLPTKEIVKKKKN